MLKNTLNGFLAGICIALGGSVFLACENKTTGAVLFSVALLCICWQGYSLYTGKICFIPEKHGKDEFSVLLCGLLGNLLATVAFGYIVRLGIPSIGEKALSVCTGKLEGQSFVQTLVRGFMCGILIYLAVIVYRENRTPLGIIVCIPVFILSGYEHSIADMFYFASSGMLSFRAFLFIMTVVLGNSLGGMLIPAIKLLMHREEKTE